MADFVLDKMARDGLLNPAAAARARQLMGDGQSLEDAVLAADGVSEEALLRFLGESFGLPYVDVESAAPTKEFLKNYPTRVLVRYRLLPLKEEDGVTTVAASRLGDTSGLDANEAFAKAHHFGGTPVIVRPSDGAVLEGFRPAAALREFLTAQPAHQNKR